MGAKKISIEPAQRLYGAIKDEAIPYKKGDLVTIRKGTYVFHRGEWKRAGRTYKIIVHHVLPGASNYDHKRERPIPYMNPRVVWPGTGGYWSECDINDVLDPDPIITLAQAEDIVGEPAKEWAGRCFEIASLLTENRRALKGGTDHPLQAGVAVYGHWLGSVHAKSYFGLRGRDRASFQRHGWIVMPDGTIVDPTRFAFEGGHPYIYIGPNNGEYDEGGTQLRTQVYGASPPEHDPEEEQFKFPSSKLASGPWNLIEKLLDIDVSTQEPGTLCMDQLRWLANVDPDRLGAHAGAIYQAIESIRKGALIPIDNRMRVARSNPG